MDQQAGDDADAHAWDLVDDESEKESSSLELHREWSSRHTHFHTLGYRDGIEEGKKSSVQQGFDVGYSQGIEAGRVCGLSRGWAGAFKALPRSIQSLLMDENARMHMDVAQAALSSLSSERAAYHFYEKINRPDVLADPMQEVMKTSSDASMCVDELHTKLQTVLRSSGILH